MKWLRFTLFSGWLLGLLFLHLRNYPLPLHGGLELLRSLAVLGLLLGAWLAAGRSLLQAFRVFCHSLSQEALLSMALGAGLMSFAGFLLGHLGWLSPASAWILLALFWLPAIGHLEHFFTELRRSLKQKHPWEGSSTEMLTLLAAGLGCATLLLLCLAPVSSYDALVYHLALPERAAALGQSLPQNGNLYSWLPGGAERLWTFCLLLDGGSSRLAGLLNFSFCLALALALSDTGARFLPKAQLWLPASLFLTQPLFLLSFGSFGSDGPAAFFCFLSLACFLCALSERNQAHAAPWLFLAALLAGMGVSVKPVALIHAAALLLLFALKSLGEPALRRPGLLLGLAGIFLLPLLPWLLRNALLAGNPLMPFGLKLFGWELFKPASSLYLEHLGGYGENLSLWSLPWELSFHAKATAFGGGGHLSFLFLGALPAVLLLGLFSELRWLAAYLFLSFLLWAAGPRVLRYAVPALPGLCILASACLAGAEVWARSKGLSVALRLFTALALFLGAGQAFLICAKDFNPFHVALGLQSREDYLLSRGLNTVRAAAWLKERAPSAKLLLLGDSRTAGLPPQTLACSVFEEHPFKSWLESAKSAQELDAILAQKGYDFALINFAELNRVLSGPPPHYDYAPSPAAAKRLVEWLKRHQGKGFSGDSVELFPIPGT
jgi:hypothetical protein